MAKAVTNREKKPAFQELICDPQVSPTHFIEKMFKTLYTIELYRELPSFMAGAGEVSHLQLGTPWPYYAVGYCVSVSDERGGNIPAFQIRSLMTYRPSERTPPNTQPHHLLNHKGLFQ